MIKNKVTRNLSIIDDPSIFTTYFNEFKNPDLFPFQWEMSVTDCLGYKRLNHHKDTQAGLKRHLAEMEIRIKENCAFRENQIGREMFLQVISLERSYREFYTETKRLVEKLEKYFL